MNTKVHFLFLEFHEWKRGQQNGIDKEKIIFTLKCFYCFSSNINSPVARIFQNAFYIFKYLVKICQMISVDLCDKHILSSFLDLNYLRYSSPDKAVSLKGII